MGKKQSHEVEKGAQVIFSADLQMRRISKQGVRYAIENPEGLALNDLHHIEVGRAFFPKDDNFSMDFMNVDLKPQGDPAEQTKDHLEAIKSLKKKQAEFRKFLKFKLVIMREE